MIIKEIKISELEEFVNSDLFNNSANIPISKHRALSQANNPRAESNDIALIIGTENNELAGYIGILPDKIFVDGKEQKIGWLSCLWINPAFRGQGLAKKILQDSIKAYDNNILLTDFTQDAQKLYESTGEFIEMQKLKGKKAFLRFDINEILLRKKSALKFISPLLKCADTFANMLQDLRLKLWIKNNRSKYHTEQISEIDEDVQKFIETHNEPELTKRKKDELNWVLKFPWILQKPKDNFAGKYYFSSVAKRFEYLPLKIYNDQRELRGFIILEIRNELLKIPYAYFKPTDSVEIMKIIFKKMIELKINAITLYNWHLIEELASFPFIFKKDTSRLYFASKKLKINFKKYRLQAGDGDCVFT